MATDTDPRAALAVVAFLAVFAAPMRTFAVEQQQLDAFTRDALQRAYDDTHASRTFYSAVIARLGKVDPFVGVLEGEARQERALKALAKANEVTVSPEPMPRQPPMPASVKDACSAAVDLEKRSVALYDDIIANVKNSAIRANFENYRETAVDHQLPAFQRCVTRGGGTPPVSDTGNLPDSKGGTAPQPNAVSSPSSGGAAAGSSASGATSADTGATAGETARCESCGMTGCGCDKGAKTGDAASAAPGTSTTKAGGQHTCGCMRGKTSQ